MLATCLFALSPPRKPQGLLLPGVREQGKVYSEQNTAKSSDFLQQSQNLETHTIATEQTSFFYLFISCVFMFYRTVFKRPSVKSHGVLQDFKFF